MVEHDKMTKELFMSMDLDSLSKSDLEKVIFDVLKVVEPNEFDYISDDVIREYEDKILRNRINYLIGIEEIKHIPKPISFREKISPKRSMIEYIYSRNKSAQNGYMFTNEEDFPF